MARDLIEQVGDRLKLNLHKYQKRAWRSDRRVVAIIAGTGSGKTSFGPPWFYREIQRCGPGDYLVATPTFPLLDSKALPSLVSYFTGRLDVGRYIATPTRRFVFSDEGARRTFGKLYDPHQETRILFGYAADPDSLEAATAKAAWIDEAGQKKFRVGSYYALRRRLGLHRGRLLITTTVYYLGWLKSLIYDRWKAGDKDIDVIQFDSLANPLYSREEFERARHELPGWLFRMQYQGLFERPPGRIYDCIDTSKNGIQRVPRFAIPQDWRWYVGMDFGEVNTAATVWAEDPQTKHLYLVHTYLPERRRSTPAHVRELRKLARSPFIVGGAASESDWRDDYRQSGYPVRVPSATDRALQINATYAVWSSGGAFAFDDLEDFWDEVEGYSFRLDELGNVTTEIEDDPSYHLLASMRYIFSEVRARVVRRGVSSVPLPAQSTDPLADYDESRF